VMTLATSNCVRRLSRRGMEMYRDKVFVDQYGCNIEQFYRTDGRCELTKQECDYEGVGGKGYCDGCCRCG
jgi:hypothetical protein